MVDFLIKNGFLLTMQGNGLGTIENGAVAIEEQDIIAVGKTHEMEKKYGNAERIINASNKAVLPGFVDGHIHTNLSLLRGEAQDVPEIEWMLKTMGPFMRFFKPDHRVKGATLGVLEALKSGTTTFGEIGANMDLIAKKVYAPAGVRANLANTINEIGPESRPDPNELYIFDDEIGKRKFREALALIEKWDGKCNGRISTIFAPHGADMMSDDLLLKVKEEALERSKLSHIHVAQGRREEIQMKLRYGMTTIEYLDSIDYFDSQIIAAHCHQTTDDEVALLAKKGVRYASCPSSIALIDGYVPPLAFFLQSGGQYATIGSDQASGNNHHNMLVEMKIAALLNKTRHKDPTILPAWKMLRLATIEGAKAIGLGDKVGSLEPGKKADIILLDLKVPHMTPILMKPVRNVAPNLVYSARGDEVKTVIINGNIVVDEGVVQTLDEEKVLKDAQKAAEEIAYNAIDDFFAANSHLAKAVQKELL